MATTSTILGPFAPADFTNSAKVTAMQASIVSAIGGNTPASVEPHSILGNVFIFVTTS